jgi:hypothetical protein
MAGIDRTAPPPPLPTPHLDQLVQEIGKLAVKFGVPGIVIVGLDPRTLNAKVYGDPKAIQALRGIVAEKFGLFDGGETSWGGGD